MLYCLIARKFQIRVNHCFDFMKKTRCRVDNAQKHEVIYEICKQF